LSEDEEKENEEIPDEISQILGHLAVEATKQNIKKIVRRWQSLTKAGMRCYRCLTGVSCFITHFNIGNSPSFPQVYNMETMPPAEIEVPSIGVMMESNLVELKMHDDLVQLYQKRLKQTSNKKVRPHEIQEEDFVLKKVLSFELDSRGK
jgi:hypothetical protein